MDLGSGGGGGGVVEIYPLSNYYFDSKEAVPDKDDTFVDRIQRMKSNFAASGMRTCVEGVLMAPLVLLSRLDLCGILNSEATYVELFRQPHILLLQVKNSLFKLPGGRLRPGESDIEGLKRKLSGKLSGNTSSIDDNWQIGECIGMWWKAEFETLPYPYLPPNTRRPKECTKLFLVRLPVSRQFMAPRNMKLLAVPLCQIHDNSKTYGPIISGISHLLSKFSFNIIQD